MPLHNFQVIGWEAAPLVVSGCGIAHCSLSSRPESPNPGTLDLQGQRDGDVGSAPCARTTYLASRGLFPGCKMGLSLLPRPLPGRKR